MITVSLVSMAHIAYAVDTNLIVCETGPNDPCTFDSLMKLAQNVTNLLIMYSVPFAVISFIYAGFLMLTSAGNTGKVDTAKKIFTDVGVGFLFVLSAWLIVKLITSALLEPGFDSL